MGAERHVHVILCTYLHKALNKVNAKHLSAKLRHHDFSSNTFNWHDLLTDNKSMRFFNFAYNQVRLHSGELQDSYSGHLLLLLFITTDGFLLRCIACG